MAVDNIDPNKTGKFIAKLRTELNLTQEDLGRAVYVTRKAVSKWETGRSTPTIDTLKQLTTILGVALDELIAGEFIEVKSETKREYVLKVLRKNWFKILGVILSICIGIIIGVVFVYNLIADKSYLINYEDDNFSITNGIIMLSTRGSYISIGNFFANFNDINTTTRFKMSLYYLDCNGDENYLLELARGNSVLLDKEVSQILKDALKDKDNSFHLKVEFTSLSGENNNYDLPLKITEAPKDKLGSMDNAKSRIEDRASAEDGINLSFLFEMNDETIEKHLNEKTIEINNSTFNIRFDGNSKTLYIVSYDNSVVLYLKSRRIFFNNKNTKTIIINSDNVVRSEDLDNINYQLLNEISVRLRELYGGY